MWLFSPRILPIVILVIIPFTISILVFILYSYGYRIPELGSINYTFGVSTLTVAVPDLYLVCFVTLVYGFYPIKFSYLKRRGFVDLIIEYSYVKKILYVEIPILFVSILILAAQFFSISFFSFNNLAKNLVYGQD